MLHFYLSLIETPEEKQKFEKLYLQNRQIMYHTAYKILKNQEHAEDATHQSFLKLIEIWGEIKHQACPQIASLSVIISRNIALNFKRNNKYRNYIPLEDIPEIMSQYSTSDEALENISIETVMNRIQELPEIYKDTFMLYIGNDMAFTQIAKTLKISEATVRKRVQRGRLLLIALLEKEAIHYA